MKTAAAPRKLPRQARSRMMVQTILESTANVVVARGYAGTNTNLVAERAGVSVGSVYQYFPNKDSLIAALHERHAQALNEAVQAVAERQDITDLCSHLRLLAKASLEVYLREPALQRLLDKDFASWHDAAAASSCKHRLHQSLEQLLGRWHDRIVQVDLSVAAWLTGQMISTLIKGYVLDAPQLSSEGITEAIGHSLCAVLCKPA